MQFSQSAENQCFDMIGMKNSLQNSMVGLRHVISHGNFGLLDGGGRGSSRKLHGALDGSDDKTDISTGLYKNISVP